MKEYNFYRGFDDYSTYPFDNDELAISVAKAIRFGGRFIQVEDAATGKVIWDIEDEKEDIPINEVLI
jgi:hypothetical protein